MQSGFAFGIAAKDALEILLIAFAPQVVALAVFHTGKAGIRVESNEGELGTQGVVGIFISQHSAHAGNQFLALDGRFCALRQQRRKNLIEFFA